MISNRASISSLAADMALGAKKHLVTLLVIAVIIVAVVVLAAAFKYKPVTASDGQVYHMRRYRNYKEAAEVVAGANQSMIKFLDYLRQKYNAYGEAGTVDTATGGPSASGPGTTVSDPGAAVSDPTIDVIGYPQEYRRRIVRSILRSYNPEVIYENPPGGSSTSYTTNKGAAIHLCVRQSGKPQELVGHNDLMFVVLHEVSHIGNYAAWGHGERFWEVFKFILTEAVVAGIYTPVNYAQFPITYCGLYVAYNPLYDPTVQVI